MRTDTFRVVKISVALPMMAAFCAATGTPLLYDDSSNMSPIRLQVAPRMAPRVSAAASVRVLVERSSVRSDR